MFIPVNAIMTAITSFVTLFLALKPCLKYRRGNFMYNQWGCISIYRALYNPFDNGPTRFANKDTFVFKNNNIKNIAIFIENNTFPHLK